VVATAAAADLDYVRGCSAEGVMDYQAERFEELATRVDVVLDTVGGDTQQRSLRVPKPGGILCLSSHLFPRLHKNVIAFAQTYLHVDVTTARLTKITELFDSGQLVTGVGTVLPLKDARIAHEMLGGAPHKRGKIV